MIVDKHQKLRAHKGLSRHMQLPVTGSSSLGQGMGALLIPFRPPPATITLHLPFCAFVKHKASHEFRIALGSLVDGSGPSASSSKSLAAQAACTH